MKTQLREALRKQLDQIIEEWRLHSHPDEPVNVEPVLEAYRAGFRNLSERKAALTLHWKEEDIDYYRVIYDFSLQALSAAAKRRHAGAHELVHIVAAHDGTKFGLSRRKRECRGIQKRIDDAQEHECEMGAAYLLVPMQAFELWRGYDFVFIARKLDVPEHLVKLRWDMKEAELAA